MARPTSALEDRISAMPMTSPATGRLPPAQIDLLVSDVDGTLVTPDKVLTAQAAAAVRGLSDAGIDFTLISSRPPRGMTALASALNLERPFAAFNGGTLVAADGRLIASHRLSERAARTALDLLAARDIDAWVFADGDWRLRNPSGPYVAAHRSTVGFDPLVVEDFTDVLARIDKIVAICAWPAQMAAVQSAARAQLAGQATIDLSQTTYLDITHPDANKGRAVQTLCAILGIEPRRTAVIGDMMNDVGMFEVAGLAIAMGQAPDAVKARADLVARSNADEGFADAVARFVLRRASEAQAAS
jgi:Cof subfamily protein (haloacid dehalogenase superfamily)